MRILVISNFYPPHVLGGYELGCHDVVRMLGARGHDVAVLTSIHGVGAPAEEGAVRRWLRPSPLDAAGRTTLARALRRQVANQLAFDRACRRHRPDVVYVWNLAKLPIALALRAESRGPVCYYVSDAWLARWTDDGWYADEWHRASRADGRLGGAARELTRLAFAASRLTWTRPALGLRHVHFCSAFMKEATRRAGRPVAGAEVIHWGVDVERYSPDRANGGSRARLLYVGQVVPHKGVHTAIEALRRVRERGRPDATLTIVGALHESAYAARLRDQIAAAHLGDAVRFLGPQPRERLPAIYREHGILVFPSCGDEPFAITPLEAMASGLPVVGTMAGGSGEVLEDGVNALTFAAEDAAGCAAQIGRLLECPRLAEALAREARQTVSDRFTLSGMVDRIESGLQRAVRAPVAAGENANGA